MFFEFSVNGIVSINPSFMKVISFTPNLFEIKAGGFLYFLEVIRLLFQIYLLLTIGVKMFDKSFWHKIGPSSIISLLLQLLIVGFVVSNFI